MVKKTKRQSARESEAALRYEKARQYKWEFLRRNENYVRDCERWSGRQRDRWNEREVILSFPYTGMTAALREMGTGQIGTDDEYFKRYERQWDDLRSTAYHHRAKKGGQRRSERRRKWTPYWKKWHIILPVHPSCEDLPSFVSFQRPSAVYHSLFSGYPAAVGPDDLQPGSRKASYLLVDWTSPSEEILSDFERILAGVKARLHLRLRSKGIELMEDRKRRTRFEEYSKYLQIYDLRRSGLTFERIAEVIYPHHKSPESAVQLVKANFNAAKRLVNGGYKKIRE